MMPKGTGHTCAKGDTFSSLGTAPVQVITCFPSVQSWIDCHECLKALLLTEFSKNF